VVASKVLGIPVRRGNFPVGISPEIAKPENASVLGLLHYALEDHGLPGETKKETSFLGKIGGLLGM